MSSHPYREDKVSHLTIYNNSYASRLIVGTSRYPSPLQLKQSIEQSGTNLVTVSLRRQQNDLHSAQHFIDFIQQSSIDVLPNTAGCESVKEAMTLAHMSREIFNTDLIKLELVADQYRLEPDMEKTLDCARLLLSEGFKVLPYCTDNLEFCVELATVGCQVVMPWGAPIGSGQGLQNPEHLMQLRKELPDTTLIVDAGIGKPSHAAQAMELGFDGVLLNTAIAKAQSPHKMAHAMKLAVQAGREAFKAGTIIAQNFATPSTPTLGMPFRD
ncbi:thiazole synthase [Reinekea forsetii]|nr:thiazole synthase [Reinekea forsetii]